MHLPLRLHRPPRWDRLSENSGDVACTRSGSASRDARTPGRPCSALTLAGWPSTSPRRLQVSLPKGSEKLFTTCRGFAARLFTTYSRRPSIWVPMPTQDQAWKPLAARLSSSRSSRLRCSACSRDAWLGLGLGLGLGLELGLGLGFWGWGWGWGLGLQPRRLILGSYTHYMAILTVTIRPASVLYYSCYTYNGASFSAASSRAAALASLLTAYGRTRSEPHSTHSSVSES